jgi:hypothetical protein
VHTGTGLSVPIIRSTGCPGCRTIATFCPAQEPPPQASSLASISRPPLPSVQPRSPASASSQEVGAGKGPRRRQRRPTWAFSSDVPVSLPKSLEEENLNFPSLQSLKEKGAGWPRATANRPRLQHQSPTPTAPRDLPFHPCNIFNIPGS